MSTEESLDGRDGMLERSNRVILLDRDGVLNVDRPDSVKALSELEIEPGALEATTRLTNAGYRLLVVTNQACVARGWVTLDTLEAIHGELGRRLGGNIAGFFVCPHGPDNGCACRKPGTLLLEQARDAWRFDPAETWFVLDAGRDIEAARRFGCRPALVRTGKGQATELEFPEVPVWDDLPAFASWVVERDQL